MRMLMSPLERDLTILDFASLVCQFLSCMKGVMEDEDLHSFLEFQEMPSI